MDNKRWYEKVNIWIGIIAGIFSILGISIFNSKSFINKETTIDSDNQSILEENNVSSQSSLNEEDVFSQQNESDYKEEEDSLKSESSENKSDDFVGKSESENIVQPFITSSPKSDGVTCVDLVNWSDEDRDIFNNNYSGNNTMKLSVYNMINAIGGGSHDITAEIHLPFGGRIDSTWVINFVVMQDMLGNGSYANVTILSDNEEICSPFTIKSDTTDEISYEVNLSGIRELIIRFECHAVDSGFCGGVIFNDKEEI